MQIVDTRGQLCPAPLILTKRAIKEASHGDHFTVITDNDTARQNLLSFLAEMKLQTNCIQKGNEFHITFSTDGTDIAIPHVEEFCETPQTGSYIVAVKSEIMGSGSDELGMMLMRSCINSLIELDSLPQAIIMYNGGVKLAGREKDTAESMEKLALQGVKIIVCGACIDYFGIKEELTPAAQISNMYTINTMLSTASSVIYP